MIPINSIAVSRNNLSFNSIMELYSIFDLHTQLFDETIEVENIEIIKRKYSEFRDLNDKTLIDLFEEYKNYRFNKFNVDVYMGMFKDDYEPTEIILNNLRIEDLNMRPYIRDYIKSKYFN
jgi:hypothetical protein